MYLCTPKMYLHAYQILNIIYISTLIKTWYEHLNLHHMPAIS